VCAFKGNMSGSNYVHMYVQSCITYNISVVESCRYICRILTICCVVFYNFLFCCIFLRSLC
jgi:hypothetical protein